MEERQTRNPFCKGEFMGGDYVKQVKDFEGLDLEPDDIVFLQNGANVRFHKVANDDWY